MKQWLALPLCIAVLSGCAKTPPLGGSPEIQVTDARDLPAPTGVDEALGVRPYKIGVGDELTIDIAGFEDVRERKVLVDGNGRISVPYGGDFVAVGKRPSELQAEVVTRLQARFVRDPWVTINVSNAQSQLVTVDGEVTEPGVYQVSGRLTLMQAVARAKGVSELAKLEDVVIFRTVDGRRMVALYNLAAIRRGAYPDPQVYADDVVVVGESPGRRLFKNLLQASPLLLSPLVAVLQ